MGGIPRRKRPVVLSLWCALCQLWVPEGHTCEGLRLMLDDMERGRELVRTFKKAHRRKKRR